VERESEEDGREDSLEHAVKDYQDTLNQSEPAEWRPEEESIVLADGSEGRVTEAHEIGDTNPEDENLTRLTILGEDLTTHENQEATDKPATNNEETTETPKQEEYSTGTDRWSHTTNEETQPPKYCERNHDQPEERIGPEPETFWNAIRDLEQTLEQQQAILENNKRTETSVSEKPYGEQYKENEAKTNENTKHQEEGYPCFKFDNPKAFIEANRELLVKEGIHLENNEAKLGEKTTLKLNEKEGLTIIHENQNYKITQVEHERIGEMEVNRYKTKQEEEFLHIPKENKMSPPYETPWYALPKTTSIYLDKSYQRELFNEAKEKAGGIKALQQELEKIGAHTHRDSLYDYTSGRANGMFTEKLIPMLRYLHRDLDEPTRHIRAIGKGEAIENPKIPFKLDNSDGSLLIAARLSDGTLYTTEGRGPRFSYRNNDEEQRNRVAESLRNVFGEINTKYIHYTENGRDRSLITTLPEIVGCTLQRAGAISGEVIKQNPDIPTFIREGTKEMKCEWLRQVFGDEGSPNAMMRAVEMTRAVEVTNRLSDEQRSRLDKLSERWEKTAYPDGREQKYTRFSRLPDDIKEAMNIGPRLLQSEERMLRQDFGIKAEITPGKTYAREGGYSLMCVLRIAREHTRTFRDEIGFPQQRKQGKLEKMLENEGGK
jgi:hypothetical protein